MTKVRRERGRNSSQINGTLADQGDEKCLSAGIEIQKSWTNLTKYSIQWAEESKQNCLIFQKNGKGHTTGVVPISLISKES